MQKNHEANKIAIEPPRKIGYRILKIFKGECCV
jgi:hypothetical protein